ncbi:hypothetical protein PENTCL1PPCAC_24167, partial [Pristionchus entomophagus]
KKEKKEEKDDDENDIIFTFDGKTKAVKIKELVRIHQMGKPIEIEEKNITVMALNPIAKQAWELRRESIELVKKLCEGAFGEVWSGKQKIRIGKTFNVAVKVIKRSSNNEKATTELQKEGSLMKKFKHDNIVRTFGRVIQRDTIMVVMELINKGLNDYVKTHKVSMNDKGSFAHDIALGLGYIHSLNCIHRDIACRNCLIDVGRKQAKVSDFGLTRQTDVYKIQACDRIPIRWIAPEVLKSYEYTRAADTYAYAIMVWELFNDGATPFGTMTNAQNKEGIIREDFRPPFAADVPPEVTDIIGMCWRGDPTARPQFPEVQKALKKFKKAGADEQEKSPALASNPPSSDLAGNTRAQAEQQEQQRRIDKTSCIEACKEEQGQDTEVDQEKV